jgi:hypothetical protein
MHRRIARRAALPAVTALGIMLMGATVASAASSTKWELRGSRIIGCCCASPCPCRINKPPMYAHGCDATTAVRIDKGTLAGTRMDGVTFIITGRGFGENVEGNWGYVYVSDKATDAQVKALQGMFEADAKSWGAKAPHLAGKFLGMRQVPMTYEVSADRRMYSATIPGILEIRTRAIILPGRTKPAVSTGIFDAFGDRFVHAEALVHTYKDPQTNYEWDLTGRQCNHADFKLTSAMAAKGGIGWGCWSAHASLGSKDKYQERIIQDTKHE